MKRKLSGYMPRFGAKAEKMVLGALNTLRKGKESFTDVILRKFAKSKSRDLLNYVKAMEIDREILILASDVEEIYKNRDADFKYCHS